MAIIFTPGTNSKKGWHKHHCDFQSVPDTCLYYLSHHAMLIFILVLLVIIPASLGFPVDDDVTIDSLGALDDGEEDSIYQGISPIHPNLVKDLLSKYENRDGSVPNLNYLYAGNHRDGSSSKGSGQIRKRFFSPRQMENKIRTLISKQMGAPFQKKNLLRHEKPWQKFIKMYGRKDDERLHKREKEKRLLKIIRLKKNGMSSPSEWGKSEEKDEPANHRFDISPAAKEKTPDHQLVDNHKLHSGEMYGAIIDALNDAVNNWHNKQNDHFNSINRRCLRKRALKILRLRRFDDHTVPATQRYAAAGHESNIPDNYKDQLNMNKRALKILRLKKSRGVEEDDKAQQQKREMENPGYLSILNPAGKYRFGRSSPLPCEKHYNNNEKF